MAIGLDDDKNSAAFWRAAARRSLEAASTARDHAKIKFHLLSAADYQERAALIDTATHRRARRLGHRERH